MSPPENDCCSDSCFIVSDPTLLIQFCIWPSMLDTKKIKLSTLMNERCHSGFFLHSSRFSTLINFRPPIHHRPCFRSVLLLRSSAWCTRNGYFRPLIQFLEFTLNFHGFRHNSSKFWEFSMCTCSFVYFTICGIWIAWLGAKLNIFLITNFCFVLLSNSLTHQHRKRLSWTNNASNTHSIFFNFVFSCHLKDLESDFTRKILKSSKLSIINCFNYLLV